MDNSKQNSDDSDNYLSSEDIQHAKEPNSRQKREKSAKKDKKGSKAKAMKSPEVQKLPEPTISEVLEEGKDFAAQGNMAGRNFQSKIMALYMCRGRDLKNFRVATEVSAAGKFDDLVFSYENDCGQRTYCLLQAKQILKKEQASNAIKKITPHDLKSPTDPTFSLLVYFESYIEILSVNKGVSIEYLILFTNADFDHSKLQDADCPSEGQEDQESKITVRKIEVQERSLIPANSYQFVSLPTKLKADLTKKEATREHLLSEFLGKLVYAVNQPDYNAIDLTIKSELSDRFNLLESDDMFNEVLGKVWNVYSQSRGKAIEEKVEQKDVMSTMFLSGVRFQNHPRGVNYSDYFKATDSVLDFLGGESESLLGISSSTPALTSLKVAQALRRSFADRHHPEQYFAVIDDRLLLSQKDRVKYTFKRRKEFVLVVRWGQTKALPWELVHLWKRLVETAKTANKRLVYIRESDSDFQLCSDGSEKWTEFEDRCEFNDITEATVACFMGSDALLQGEMVKWSEMINIETFNSMETNVSILNDSLKHGQLPIGKPIKGLEGMESSYIGRTFTWLLSSRKDSLEYIPNSELVVFGPEEKKNLKNFPGGKNVKLFQGRREDIKTNAVMMRDDEDFDKICALFPDKNVHWLVVKDDGFESKNMVANVYPREAELAKNGLKVHIITGEPGMGKSVVMTRIASLIKRHAAFWVVQLNLLDASELLDALKEKEVLNKEDVLDLVYELGKLEKPYEKELFAYYLNKTDKICFFADGFDDICPQYEGTVIKLLNLLDDTDSHIWVSTRPRYKSELESEFSCCAYHLVAFTTEDQKKLLVSLFAEPGNEMATAFTERILTEFSHPSFQFVSQCLKIPLLTKMVGEIYREDYEKFCKQPDNRVVQQVGNTLELYDKLIQMKYEFYLEEKAGGKITNPQIQARIQGECQRFTDVHKMLAVQLLFPEELKRFIDNKLVENEEEIDRLLNVGIIVDNSSDLSKVSFVHRTFAEYFVAKVLAEVVIHSRFNWFLHKPSQKCIAVIKFFKARYFDENHRTLRIFFDGLLAEGSELLMAILNDDFQKVKQLVEEDPGCVTTMDKLKRTPMHLAAAYSRYQPTKGGDEEQEAQSVLPFLWKYRKRMQFCNKDYLDFTVLSYAMGSVNLEPNQNTVFLYLSKKFRDELGQNNLNKMF